MITKQIISKTVVELLRRVETSLPGDVEKALEKAYKKEKEEIPRIQLKAILENVKYARENSVPLCQDTGILIFYLKIGNKLESNLDLIKESIKDGVKKATKEIPLRPNTVHPLTRKNSGNNTGIGIPYFEIEILKEKGYLEIIAFPKGAGSENFSSMKMLNPSDGISGIKRFVIETLASAGGKPCPPTVVGIGIGDSADGAMKLAKKSLLRKIGSRNNDKDIAKLEKELLREINSLGIGPMGLGGKTSCLGVNIEFAYCHTASLPLAINIQCWANRRATARIYNDGRVKFLED